MKALLPTAAMTLVLAACSPASDTQGAANDVALSDNGAPATEPTASPAPTPSPAASPSAAADILTLEGLGGLRIGQPVAAGSGWAERGAQASDTCRTVTSPVYPGAYAIVEQGAVRRITIGQQSDVKLIEGIGIGSPEREVIGAFPGFRAEPHKYEDEPAKYLTAPNAEKGDVALRFEIGGDGKVKAMHVGTWPVLGYVEGCA